jgi:deoxyribonuclease-4
MSPLSFRFGTVGSPIATPKKPGGSVGAAIFTAELGLGGLELGWVRSVRVSENTCSLIREAAEEHDVALSVHAPYFINLNADGDEWPRSRKRLMDAAITVISPAPAISFFTPALTLDAPLRKFCRSPSNA